MHFIIHCLDYEGKLNNRLEHYDAHKSYLQAADSVKQIISGPLLAGDNQTMIGSCFLVEADSLDDVEKFHQSDPFYKAGIWEKISICPFLKRVDKRGD